MIPLSALVVAAVLCGRAAAQDPSFDSINRPLKNEQVPAGQTFTVTWTFLSPDTPTGPATITLIGGASTASLNPIAAIGHVNNSDLKFDWAVDASLGAEPVYGLNITLDADQSHFQYSNPFQIVGGAGESATLSATASATSSVGTTTGTTASTGAADSTTMPTTAATDTAETTALRTASTASTTSTTDTVSMTLTATGSGTATPTSTAGNTSGGAASSVPATAMGMLAATLVACRLAMAWAV